MTKNKKNKKLSLLLILAIISLVVLLASFARYTGVAGEANDTAKVAKWSVTLNGDGKIFTHTYAQNLTAKDAAGNYIIAPGVDGAYEIKITNAGDVTATISNFALTESAGNAAVPMQFSTTGLDGSWGTLASAVSTLTTAASGATIAPGGEETVGTLYWKWPFSGEGVDNAKDTAIGTNSTTAATVEGGDRTSYGLEMTITAEQVAPAK